MDAIPLAYPEEYKKMVFCPFLKATRLSTYSRPALFLIFIFECLGVPKDSGIFDLQFLPLRISPYG